MPKATSTTKTRGRLPNAPLAEAVFELRWALQGEETLPIPLRTDPGLPALVSEFTELARKSGFTFHREMVPLHQLGGWGVFRRYYLQEGRDFPLLQIGPGIFAANQSADYEWKSFKKLVTIGLKNLLKAYPKTKDYPLKPVHLELRYVDVLDQGLIAASDFIAFTRKATHLNIAPPAYFDDRKLFGVVAGGRVQLNYPAKDRQNTTFQLDYVSGLKETKAVVQLTTKVVSTDAGVPKTVAALGSSVDAWLDAAHELLSGFFREFVRPETLERFKEKVQA
jgi:uncharacterized protein (TIGR04255 family)